MSVEEMTNNNDSGTDTTQDPDAAPSTDGAEDGSQAGGDASLWQSRFNGLNAKLGETVTQKTAVEQERDRLAKELADLRSGTVNADEAAKAQVAAIKAELEQERMARQVESLKARFPETFEVFGDTAATFTPDVLAASEARLAGAGDDPTPLRHNESRSGARKEAKEETAADVEARLLSMKVPWSI
jgi:hypothetical protein